MTDRQSFIKTVGFFVDACPGPALARRGLTIAALQRVRGIPGLWVEDPPEQGGGSIFERARSTSAR